MRYSIPLVVFVLLVALLGIGLKLDPGHVPSPLIGKPLPAFSLPTLHDEKKVLASGDLRDEVALLNVWASWCVACRTEHPLLVALKQNGRVNIYGLNYKDDRQDALDWLARLGDPYRASAFDRDGRAGLDMGVYGVPETFVIDRNGIIRYKHIGPITPDVLEKKLLPLIRALEAPAT